MTKSEILLGSAMNAMNFIEYNTKSYTKPNNKTKNKKLKKIAKKSRQLNRKKS
jgi:hypothetical protein